MAVHHWRPILSGEIERLARERISRIAADLAPAENSRPMAPSLMAGAAGVALLYAYRDQTLHSHPTDAANAQLYLNEAIEGADGVGSSLAHGMSGIAWAAEHLTDPSSAGEDPNAAIDQALPDLLEAMAYPAKSEMMHAMESWAFYALERMPSPNARTLLERIVARLRAQGRRGEEGLSWWIEREYWPEEQRAAANVRCDLGVAHGQTGLIGILAAASAWGVSDALSTLRSASGFFWSARLPDSRGGFFPAFAGELKPAAPAWCYGDAGIAGVLMAAAQATNDAEWAARAVEIARRAAQLAPTKANQTDPSLCHGAAGLGHIFNRLHQATGDGSFLDAARYWLGRAVELPLPEEPGLLQGKAGIGLALLASLGSIEPAWDRVLLLSLHVPE